MTKKALLAVCLLTLSAACRKGPAYELDVLYDEKGYMVLHVPPRGDKPSGAFGLRRSDMYVAKDAAASWMVFWGDKPPAYNRPHGGTVLKNPFLVRVDDGTWQVSQVEHLVGEAKLKAIRPDFKGRPVLVYEQGGAELLRKPAGWTTIRKVTFKPAPAKA